MKKKVKSKSALILSKVTEDFFRVVADNINSLCNSTVWLYKVALEAASGG